MDTCEDVRRKRRRRKRRSRVTGPSSEAANKFPEQVDHLAGKHGQTPSRGAPTAPRRRRAASETKRPQTGMRSTRSLTRKSNALERLNKLRPGLHFDAASRTGPPHAPVFAVGVRVNGLSFEGRGPTKKRAKTRAAELALKSFVQFPDAATEDFGSAADDFTADRLDLSQMFCTDGTEGDNWTWDLKRKEDYPQSDPKSRPRGVVSSWPSGCLGPTGLLDELRPGLRYFCLAERVPRRPERRFMAAVRVDGRISEGCGRSKRAAKARAAAAALRWLYGVGRQPVELLRDKRQLPQFFAESIFQIASQKCRQLRDQSLATHNMAAIIMTIGFELSSAEVISMATGTKCLDRDATCGDDSALRDCHAEVVCRRALLRFLYAQLEMLLIRPPDETDVGSVSIFEPAAGCRRVFRLRDHVGLHMFVTSSPCGDARLNCPYENQASPSTKTNTLRSGLRTKVVGGQGTLPVKAHKTPIESPHQKRASLSPGKPQVSMSCTDKMAKWCAVGLQGALLSHLVEPVYLQSLTVATLSHTGHLRRVLARRLAPNKRHAAPYRRQLPMLACLGRGERRARGNSSRVSVNWSWGDGDTEELSTASGLRRHCGTRSRLSGRCFFARWQRLHRRLNDWTPEDTLRTHVAWKRAAGPYQKATQHFGGALRDAGLGAWSRKLTQSHQDHDDERV
ncbi:double-stranded RNA-specific editase B2-like [Vanacampus margaritifer]